MDLSKLEPTDVPEKRPGMSDTEWAIEWVLSRRGSKAYKAGVYMFKTGGSVAIPALVEAACESERKPAHRVRLLDVILETGGPLSAEDFSVLLKLLDHRSRKVSDKAREVLRTLCPDGRPPLVPPEILEPFSTACYRHVDKAKKLLGIAR